MPSDSRACSAARWRRRSSPAGSAARRCASRGRPGPRPPVRGQHLVVEACGVVGGKGHHAALRREVREAPGIILELNIGVTEPLQEGFHNRLDHARLPLQQVQEVLFRERQAVRCGFGPHRGRARRLVEQGHFAKAFPGLQLTVSDGLAVPLHIDVHGAGEYQEQTIGRVAFAEDHVARRIDLLAQVLGNQLELSRAMPWKSFTCWSMPSFASSGATVPPSQGGNGARGPGMTPWVCVGLLGPPQDQVWEAGTHRRRVVGVVGSGHPKLGSAAPTMPECAGRCQPQTCARPSADGRSRCHCFGGKQ